MDFETFRENLARDIKETLEARTGTDFEVEHRTAEKMNGNYEAIVVKPADSEVGVSLNASTLYKDYESGVSYETIAKGAADLADRSLRNQPEFDVDSFKDYDKMKLENYLHFRSDSMQYFYDAYLKELGGAKTAGKIITKFPGGQKLMGTIIKGTFKELLDTEHGTKHWLDNNMEDHIDAYWGSKKAWEALPEKVSEMEEFTDWDKVVHIDHGYDESKPESELTLEDMKGAAKFRGGTCDSTEMKTGDWKTPLEFTCQFGHHFKGSPRLILEGGHWCDECERKSWNYGMRARKDKFFAQVWNPLHDEDEIREYPKTVSELEV